MKTKKWPYLLVSLGALIASSLACSINLTGPTPTAAATPVPAETPTQTPVSGFDVPVTISNEKFYIGIVDRFPSVYDDQQGDVYPNHEGFCPSIGNCDWLFVDLTAVNPPISETIATLVRTTWVTDEKNTKSPVSGIFFDGPQHKELRLYFEVLKTSKKFTMYLIGGTKVDLSNFSHW